MKVPLAVLCDAANVSREGKLNILGIFSALRAIQFPHSHPSLTLVVGLEATYTERGDHSIDIRLVDADGSELLKLDGRAHFQSDRAGHPIFTQAILTLNNLTFPRAGTYTVDILVDRRHERSLLLEVQEILKPQPEAAGDGSEASPPV
ncbi:MAG: hypothetical protein ABR599_08835 [Gemmatimonadota bacterium]